MVMMVMTTCNYNCRHNYDYVIQISQSKKQCYAIFHQTSDPCLRYFYGWCLNQWWYRLKFYD